MKFCVRPAAALVVEPEAVLEEASEAAVLVSIGDVVVISLSSNLDIERAGMEALRWRDPFGVAQWAAAGRIKAAGMAAAALR